MHNINLPILLILVILEVEQIFEYFPNPAFILKVKCKVKI